MASTRATYKSFSSATTAREDSPVRAYFRITDLINDWYDGTAENYGVAIKRRSGTISEARLIAYESDSDYYAYMGVKYSYHIPDGVYGLRSAAHSGRWITVANESTSAGSLLQQQQKSSPVESFDRSSLFKISRVGTTSRYIIRSMLNNNLSIGISNGQIVTKQIPSADADVPEADTFCIEWSYHAYIIYPYGTTTAINMVSTSTANLNTISKTDAEGTNNAKWDLVMYTGIHDRNVELHFSDDLIAGETVFCYPAGWSTEIDHNKIELAEAPGFTDNITLTWNESLQRAEIDLHYNGFCAIYKYIYNDDGTVDARISEVLSINAPIEEGVYFIKNKQVAKYMQIDNDDSPDYSTSGAHVELWDFEIEDQGKWQLVHVSDGYYKIISVKSGLALAVQSSHLNQNEYPLVQETYANVDRMKWKITKTTSGSYIFRPKSAEAYSTDWCMCAGDQFLGVTDGLNVEQKAYVNDSSYKDEWFLYVTHEYAHLTFNSRVFYDSSITLTSSDIESLYEKATVEFLSKFNIAFNNTSISYSSELDVDPNCHATSTNQICTSSCAANILCNSQHHKSSRRLITVLTSSTFYTYRLVGYALCRYDSGSHDGVVGSGNVNGKNSITSLFSSPNAICSIQHELTHNLGGSHDTCTTDQPCVLKGNLNSWCDACKAAIIDNH